MPRPPFCLLAAGPEAHQPHRQRNKRNACTRRSPRRGSHRPRAVFVLREFARQTRCRLLLGRMVCGDCKAQAAALRVVTGEKYSFARRRVPRCRPAFTTPLLTPRIRSRGSSRSWQTARQPSGQFFRTRSSVSRPCCVTALRPPRPSCSSTARGSCASITTEKQHDRRAALDRHRRRSCVSPRIRALGYGHTCQVTEFDEIKAERELLDALRSQQDPEAHDRGLIAERLGWTPRDAWRPMRVILRFYLAIRPRGPLISE